MQDKPAIQNSYDPSAALQEDEERGILPRALQMIVEELQQRPQDSYKLYISFFEVYNEKLYDLFSVKDGSYINCLEIRENKNSEISIPDLISVEINNLDQAMNILQVGLRNRAIGCTIHNAQSSRSHSIFQILLQQRVGGQFVESSVKPRTRESRPKGPK